MWARLLLAAVLLAGAAAICVPAVAAESSTAAAPAATADPAEALKAYEEGKRRYDAGDYEGARRAFAAAARHEPGNARWPYNLGLALRQLGQPNAARAAFLVARRLDPGYKRAEIDDKLTSMGFDARDSGVTPKQLSATPKRSSVPPVPSQEVMPFWMYLGKLALIYLVAPMIALMTITKIVAWLRRRFARQPAASGSDFVAKPTVPPAKLEAEAQRLMRLSTVLVSAEHAMRLGEDHDLRALLERATQLEQGARARLAAARAGDGDALYTTASLLDAVEPVERQVQARVQALGADATVHGERVGCYFCARPLANADFRRLVPLRSQQGNAEVLACPPCADRIDRGETPEVTVLGGKGGMRHWSEDPGFDPYLNRHAPPAAATQVPAWKFTPSRPLASLALLAAGGALGAGAAYAATRVFNLDAARESGFAQEAARFAARNAAERSGSEGRRNGMRDSS